MIVVALRSTVTWIFAGAALPLLLACSSPSLPTSPTSEGISSIGSWSPVCPMNPPTPASACSLPSEGAFETYCEYGSAYVAACDAVFGCLQGVWQPAALFFGGCTWDGGTGTNPASCPSRPPATQGSSSSSSCSADAPPACWYGSTCWCHEVGGPYGVGDSGIGTAWSCAAPTPGCPVDRPRLGASCGSDGGSAPSCFWGNSVPGEEVCVDGVWQFGIAGD